MQPGLRGLTFHLHRRVVIKMNILEHHKQPRTTQHFQFLLMPRVLYVLFCLHLSRWEAVDVSRLTWAFGTLQVEHPVLQKVRLGEVQVVERACAWVAMTGAFGCSRGGCFEGWSWEWSWVSCYFNIVEVFLVDVSQCFTEFHARFFLCQAGSRWRIPSNTRYILSILLFCQFWNNESPLAV